MRILLAEVPRQMSGRRPLTRACLIITMASAVLGAGACAQTPAAKPESRLGGQSITDNHRWNGNGKRQTYDSKNLDGAGNGAASGAQSGAAGGGDTVLFTSDSTDLTPESKVILDGFIAQMRSKSARALSIEGHADERGTREYNLGLGAKRAAAVKAYLVSKGMLDSQVRTISFGKEKPVATCDDISCWARNRRAQLVVAER
jgi:peptidoglycan-associated lipoprotein